VYGDDASLFLSLLDFYLSLSRSATSRMSHVLPTYGLCFPSWGNASSYIFFRPLRTSLFDLDEEFSFFLAVRHVTCPTCCLRHRQARRHPSLLLAPFRCSLRTVCAIRPLEPLAQPTPPQLGSRDPVSSIAREVPDPAAPPSDSETVFVK